MGRRCARHAGAVATGQLEPLLDLLGVGQVVVATDGDRSRGGELGPAEVARVLGPRPQNGDGTAGTGAPGLEGLGGDGLGPLPGSTGAGTLPGVTGPSTLQRRAYGPQRTFPAAPGRLGTPCDARPSSCASRGPAASSGCSHGLP